MIFYRIESNLGHKFAFNSKKNSSLKEVEKILMKKLNVSKNCLIFYFKGKPLNFYQSLFGQGINSMDLISLVILNKSQVEHGDKLKLIVKEISGKNYTFDVSQLSKVRDFKEKFKNRIGLSIKQLKLFFQGSLLYNHNFLCYII